MNEPWLRGTLSDLPVVQRALLHSLEMAQEDTARWCGGLDDREVHARPFQLPSVAFQLRHIARSLDRFCCLRGGHSAEPGAIGRTGQRDGQRAEPGNPSFGELEESLEKTRRRLDAIVRQPLDLPVSDRSQRPAHHPDGTAGSRRRAHPATCRTSHYNGEGDSGTARSTMWPIFSCLTWT